MSDMPSYPGTPRWVKVFAVVVAASVVLAVVLVLVWGGAGRHGPGRHMPSGDTGGAMRHAGVAAAPAPPGAGLGGRGPARPRRR